MHLILAGLFAFAIVTLWAPAVWPVTVFQIGVFALCVGALILYLPRRIPYPAYPLTFAVLCGVLQLVFGTSAYAFDTKTSTVRFATFLAVFLIGVCLFADSRTRRWFRMAMLWFTFGVSIWATLQTFTAGGKVLWLFPTEYSTVMGPVLYYNHWAAFVEVVLPIALYEAFRRERDALVYAGVAAVLYASVIASSSRTGSILATLEVVGVPLVMAARRLTTGRSVGLAFLRMALLLVAFTSVVGWGRVWERLRLPDPLQGRLEFDISTLHMIAGRPLTGSGLGTWPAVYPHYATVDLGTFANQAHNDWAQFTAEGGIVFGAALFSIFVWCFRPAFRTVWGLGVLAVFTHAFVDYPFSRPALGSWPILVIAMMAVGREGQSVPGA